MYTHIYIYISIYLYICTYIYTYMCKCMCNFFDYLCSRKSNKSELAPIDANPYIKLNRESPGVVE